MSEKKQPFFGDPYAKAKDGFHEQSGSDRIDIYHGGTKPDGTPQKPQKKDGHGHMIALEIDGLYQAVSWRHPGEEEIQEYGDYKNIKERKNIYDNGADRKHNPLNDLEEDIDNKESLLNEARELMKERNYNADSVNYVLKKFSEIYDTGTQAEINLAKQYAELCERNNRHISERERNKIKKRELIALADAIKNSTEWKKTSDKMKELMDSWKQTGYAGPDNDLLWFEFQNARQIFFKREKEYFEQLKELQKQNKKQKQEIISKAGLITINVTNWSEAHKSLEDLLAQWKKIGSAGKNDDDKLWNEFNGIRNNFYIQKKAAAEKRNSEFEANRQAKMQLAMKAQHYAGSSDYSSSAATEMKNLSIEWKNIGFCGKDDEDRLWKMFHNAQDTFWNAKKEKGREKHQQWIINTHEAIERRRNRIRKLYANISDLTQRLETTRNGEKRGQIIGWIEENEGIIRELEAEISRMEAELRASD